MATLDEIERLLDEAEAGPVQPGQGERLDTGTPGDRGAFQLPAIVVGDEPAVTAPAPDAAPATQTVSDGGRMSLDQIDALLAEDLGDEGARAPTESDVRKQAVWEGPFGTIAGPISDIARGFNTRLANVIGFPIEVVNEALSFAGLEFLEKPGDAQKAIRDGFRRVGIDVRDEQVQGFFETVGSETVPAMLTLWGLFANAARMAAARGEEFLSSFVREMGRFTQRHPTATVTTTLGSVPGMVAGAERGGEVGEVVGGPTGRVVGETVGGVLGGAVTGGVAGIRTRPSTGRMAPIIDESVPVEQPHIFLERQIQREKIAIDMAIDAALNRVRDSTTNPAAASAKAFEELQRVHRNARAIEQKLWAKVPKNAVVPIDDLVQLAKELRADVDIDPDVVPSQWISRILKLAKKQGNTATVHQLRMIRSGAMRDHWAAGGSTVAGRPPNEELRARLIRLEQGIEQAIDNALGDNVAWQQARAFTREVRQRFTRGELGRILTRTAQGETRGHPEDLILDLLKRERGLRSIQEAADMSAAPAGGAVARIPGARDLLDATERAVKDYLIDHIDQTIRAAEGLNPEMARKVGAREGRNWIMKYEHRLNAMARLGREMEALRVQLDEALRREADIQVSTMAQYVKGDPENAVRYVWNAGNPAQRAKELMQQFRLDTPIRGDPNLDPEAVMGFKRAMLAELRRRSNNNPVLMKQQLEMPKYQRMFHEVFTPSEFARVKRLVDTLAGIQQGTIKTRGKMANSVKTWAAHLLGLTTGRIIARTFMTGQSGSLSIPFRMAAGMREWVRERWQSSLTAWFDEAILNPQRELDLLSQVPGTEQELRLFINRMKRALQVSQTGRYAGDRYLDHLANEARRYLKETGEDDVF